MPGGLFILLMCVFTIALGVVTYRYRRTRIGSFLSGDYIVLKAISMMHKSRIDIWDEQSLKVFLQLADEDYRRKMNERE